MESEINIWNFPEGINLLRNTLCNKKVFIVLDDVDEDEQLGVLARSMIGLVQGVESLLQAKIVIY